MNMSDFQDLDALERELAEARAQLARRAALVAVLAVLTAALALWGQ